ncbi:hypothetical protein [Streptomyces sp. V4I2]|uniref:hypothetical protein n=1 Tax=Streptomyces sp. V4I2 TaxID=3042280 RepID=UPI0027857130|nr:hypothetical protein [Streptomyces sp. V4I2]MDQ1042571.1 hypothetical protein [Streptomyces sp. V4I2]
MPWIDRYECADGFSAMGGGSRRGGAHRRTERQQRDVQLAVFLVVAVAVVSLAVMGVNWLLAHWWVLLVAAVLAYWPASAGGSSGCRHAAGLRWMCAALMSARTRRASCAAKAWAVVRPMPRPPR